MSRVTREQALGNKQGDGVFVLQCSAISRQVLAPIHSLKQHLDNAIEFKLYP